MKHPSGGGSHVRAWAGEGQVGTRPSPALLFFSRNQRNVGVAVSALLRSVSATIGVIPFVATGVLWAQDQDENDHLLTVMGTLVDEAGNPVPDVGVLLRPQPSFYEQQVESLALTRSVINAADRTSSGADGTFSVTASALGPWRLEIRQRAPVGPYAGAAVSLYLDLLIMSPVVLEPVELPDQTSRVVNVMIEGREPMEGALVVLDPQRVLSRRHSHTTADEQPDRIYPTIGRVSTRTGADGSARFVGPAADANVFVSALGFGPRSVTATPGMRDVSLMPGPTIKFRVHPVGDPGSDRGAVVVQQRAADGLRAVAVMDAFGEATVSLRPGEEQSAFVFENAEGWYTEVGPVTWSSEEIEQHRRVIDVVLKEPVLVRGRIVDGESREAVEGAAIWARSDPGRFAVADWTGFFALSLPAYQDAVSLVAMAQGYLSANVSPLLTRHQRSTELLVTLEPSALLRGSVVDDVGQAIAGASVLVEPTGEVWSFEPGPGASRRVTSAPDGSFWIPNALYGVPYRLTAETRDHPPSVYDVPPLRRSQLTRPIRIVLAEGRSACGWVVDTGGGAVADARVRLSWPSDLFTMGVAFPGRTAEVATSDAQGAFDFENVAPGQYSIGFSHPEFMDVAGKVVSVGGGAGSTELGVFTVSRGSEIVGTVLDEDLRPVTGVEVTAWQEKKGLAGQARSATTDNNGLFRLTGLLPYPAVVGARAAGYAPAIVESVKPATDGGEPLVIEIGQGASLAGLVLDDRGGGVAGARVFVSLSMASVSGVGRGLPASFVFREVWTDENGHFGFRNLMAGDWTVEARDDSGRAAGKRAELVQGELRKIEIRLQAVRHLTVYVTSHVGEPVTNATARLKPDSIDQPAVFGRSDSTGYVRLSTAAVEAVVDVSHPGFVPQARAITLRSGENSLNVQLERGREISGRLRTEEGIGCSGVLLQAIRVQSVGNRESESPGSSGFALAQGLAVTREDCSFRLVGLQPGRYRVVGRLSGVSGAERLGVVDINDRSVSGVDVVLKSVRGTDESQ